MTVSWIGELLGVTNRILVGMLVAASTPDSERLKTEVEINSMATLERAIEIAASAHAGQVDKADQPYILHPIRVMMSVSTLEERIAAVLHDTVEDTTTTIDDLVSLGFSDAVISAVKALTKTEGESRLKAARRAVQDPVARVVKLADVADNMDLSRIPEPTPKDLARLEEYKQVRALLEEGPKE